MTALLAETCSKFLLRHNCLYNKSSLYGRREGCIQGFGGET